MKRLIFTLLFLLAACQPATAAPPTVTAIVFEPTGMLMTLSPSPTATETPVPVQPTIQPTLTPKTCEPIPEGEIITGNVIADLVVNEHFAQLFHANAGDHVFFHGFLDGETLKGVREQMELKLYYECLPQGNYTTAPWISLVQTVYGADNIPIATFGK